LAPTGYEQYGSFNIRYCRIINLTTYSYVWYPQRDIYIEYNTFINSAGFSVGHSGSSIYIRYNLFKGNRGPIVENWASYAGQTIVKYNSFIDMTGIVLNLPSGYSDAAMVATENYWGTTDTKVIDSMIYDKHDDITCAGFIKYLPILTEPHPETPALPIVVDFTYEPSTLYAYGIITFNASTSFGLYSSISHYTWNFGDGNTTTTLSPVVEHTYTKPYSYHVTLTVTDEFGFQNSTTTTIKVLKDDAPPKTVHDYDGVWHNADFTINLTAFDYGSGVAETYYRINNGPIKVLSTDGQPYIATEGANNTLEYWSVDNTGNEELPHNKLTEIKLDKTQPTTSINLSGVLGNNDWLISNVSVSMSANDTLSGVDKIEYSFNNLTWTVYIAPLNITDEGPTSIYYRSVDKARNVETARNATIKIDKTPPKGSITINATYTASASVTLRLTAMDATSGVYQVRYSNDGVWDTEPWEAPSPTKAWTLTPGEGVKTVYYQIKDNSGLISDTYSDAIILDVTPPSGSIIIENNATHINITSVTLTLSATDATSGVTQMRFSHDNITWSSWEPYTISKTWVLGDGDGTKTVYVQFKDSSGLISRSYFDTIVLDRTAPAILITSPSPGYEARSSTLTVMWAGSDEVSGISRYEIRLDSGAWINIGTNTTYTFIRLADGNHTINIKAVDKAGNAGQNTVSFTVNTSPLLGPGYMEEAVVTAAIIIVTLVITLYFLKIRKR
jgi:hypothetical protein